MAPDGRVLDFYKPLDQSWSLIDVSNQPGMGGVRVETSSPAAVVFPDSRDLHLFAPDIERFTQLYAEGDPGAGIGGYDLLSSADRAFPFDYDGSGKLDHLVLYRPGTGTIWILGRQPARPI